MLLLLLLQLIVQSGKRSPAVGQCLLQPGNSISFGRVQLQLSGVFKLVVGRACAAPECSCRRRGISLSMA